VQKSAMRILILFTVFASHAETIRSFPESEKSLASPSGKYELVVKSDDAIDPAHWLGLRELLSGEEIEVMRFSRSVDVAWAPSVDRFFVNEHSQSNSSECKVASVSGGKVQWLRFSSPQESEFSCGYGDQFGHCYFSCTRWVDNQTVAAKLTYYGGSKSELEKPLLLEVEQ